MYTTTILETRKHGCCKTQRSYSSSVAVDVGFIPITNLPIYYNVRDNNIIGLPVLCFDWCDFRKRLFHQVVFRRV